MATASLPALQAFVAEMGLEPIPSFAASNVLNNPIDIYHSYLAKHFQTLVECDPDLIYDSIQPANTTENGDLDIVLPKLKLTGTTPKQLAGEILKKFQPHPLFAVPWKDGIHIRFYFSPKTIPRLILPYINDRNAMYGIDTSLSLPDGQGSGRKKVIVEFSSPNIATEFTAAHLRSTILGAFVANIYEAVGWDVVRINYLGDWGKHLGLLSVGWQKYGSDNILDEQTDQFRYVHDLYTKMEDELRPEQEARKKARDEGQDIAVLETQGLFAERDATFKRIEDGEPEEILLWKKLRDISTEYYIDTYAQLNIKFDEYSGESQVSLNPEVVAEVESILKSKGIYEEQDGAWVIDYDKHGAKLGTVTVRGRNGSTTYLLRDIATVFDRFKTHSFDKMLYVVCEQDVHFRQVFKAVELMGHTDIADRLQHITFGKANYQPSHPGTPHLLSDILDKCENHMREAISASPDSYQIEDCDSLARAMGINALVVQELLSKRAHSSSPSVSLMTSSEGETGPKLQLCYARLCSAIASTGSYPTTEEIPSIDYSSLWAGPWLELLRLMAQYPNITKSAFKTLEPGIVLSYLFRVVDELTFCLDEAEEDKSEGEGSTTLSMYAARTVLYESARQILKNGMKLLGTAPISK